MARTSSWLWGALAITLSAGKDAQWRKVLYIMQIKLHLDTLTLQAASISAPSTYNEMNQMSRSVYEISQNHHEMNIDTFFVSNT